LGASGINAGPANEPQALTVLTVGSTSSNGGTLSVNGNNEIVYTPAPDFNGTDTFQYTVRDSDGATDTATITVNVTPRNDAPVFTIPGLLEVDEDVNGDGSFAQDGFASDIFAGPATATDERNNTTTPSQLPLTFTVTAADNSLF